jgi:dihydropteroate synthase
MSAEKSQVPDLAFFLCGRYRLVLQRPLVMGVLNITPDSFSGDGKHASFSAAYDTAFAMKEQGVDILDVGGESTRPGASPVSVQEELRRVLPVLEALQPLGLPISLDSRRPEVVRQALAVGIDIINDVTGFRDPTMRALLELPQAANVGLCIMHMQGEPQTMQANPHYDNVVQEVFGFLVQQTSQLKSQGIAFERILLDPGFGFGKTLHHNLALLKALDQLTAHGHVLAGLSRKRMIGELTGHQGPPEERLGGSLAATLYAAFHKGAAVVRVHDVQPTVQALKLWAELGLRPSAIG